MTHSSSSQLKPASKLENLAKDFCHLPDTSFLRPTEIIALRIVGCSKATLYRMMAEGNFPAAIKISRGMVGVRIGDIRQWLKDPQNWEGAK